MYINVNGSAKFLAEVCFSDSPLTKLLVGSRRVLSESRFFHLSIHIARLLTRRKNVRLKLRLHSFRFRRSLLSRRRLIEHTNMDAPATITVYFHVAADFNRKVLNRTVV